MSKGSTKTSATDRGAVSGEANELSRRPGIGRAVKMIFSAFVAAAVVVAVAVWMQEDSLRDAEEALDSKDPKRALALASYYLETHPDHDHALAVKARALSELGQGEEALEIFDEIGPATTADEHAMARAYMATGQWSKAAPLMIHVATVAPDNADAMYELTTCRIRLGRFDEALDSAKKLVELPGQEARGQILMAAIYYDLGNHKKSIASYARATELSPDGSAFPLPANEVFYQYGTVLLAQGRFDEAALVLEKSIANRPTSLAYQSMGDALSQAGKTEEACKAWEMSLTLDPRGGGAREGLANAALLRGEPEAGLKYLEPLVQADQVRQNTAFLLQRLHARLDHPEEAARWKKVADEMRYADEKALAVDQLMVRRPNSFWASVIRAYRFAEEGNWNQAAPVIEDLYAEAPQDAFVAALHEAIEKRGPLPSLDDLPIHSH